MRNLIVGLAFLTLVFPLNAHGDGVFFWSARSFGTGAQPGEVLSYGNNDDSVRPLEIFLYYQPGTAEITEIEFDLKFEHYEILSAEVFDFPISLTGTPLTTRWDSIGQFKITEDAIIGFSASTSGDFFGGLDPQFTGKNIFVDEGYDDTAAAFLVGSVTLQGVSTTVEYTSASTTSDSTPIFPELQENVIEASECLADPPYGGFGGFFLTSNADVVAGINHCAGPPFETCDGTVWYTFQPQSDGLFTCDTFGSVAVDTQLEIYEGDTFNDLNLIAFNDDADGSTRSRISFPMEQGVNYSIRVVSNLVQIGGATRLGYEFRDGSFFGDVNRDNAVNLLDVAGFVDAIISGDYLPEADTNFDGNTNLLDVSPFIDLLGG